MFILLIKKIVAKFIFNKLQVFIFPSLLSGFNLHSNKEVIWFHQFYCSWFSMASEILLNKHYWSSCFLWFFFSFISWLRWEKSDKFSSAWIINNFRANNNSLLKLYFIFMKRIWTAKKKRTRINNFQNEDFERVRRWWIKKRNWKR